MSESTGYTPSLYLDVAALLAGGPLSAPTPSVGSRSDGHSLLYAGAVNVFFGPPESGKTLAASCIAADELFLGSAVLVVDIDHNGPAATIARFLALGVPATTLSDPARFRYADPDDADAVLSLVHDAAIWRPALVLCDSIGELLPIFAANSNDADDFTRVNRLTLAAFAATGAAVLAIDHEAKSVDSRTYGSSGTAAKKRAIDGAMLRFTVKQPFAPGSGGKASLSIAKDRHGSLRAASPMGEREPLATVFHLTQHSTALSWHFWAPDDTATATDPKIAADLTDLQNLVPPPRNVRDVKDRMKWGTARASTAWEAWNNSVPRSPGTPGNTEPDSVPRSPPLKEGEQEQPPPESQQSEPRKEHA